MATNQIVRILWIASSNAVSWHSVLAAAHKSSASVALFSVLWALYNKYLGRGRRPRDEPGHVGMGLLTLSCLGTARIPLVASSSSSLQVLLNVALVLAFVAQAGGIQATGTKLKKDLGVSPAMMASFWGYSFAAYIVSNAILLGICSYLLGIPLE